VKRIGIIPKVNKKEALDTIGELIPWLEERGITTILDHDSAHAVGLSSEISREDVPKTADMVIVLGGDGTLLYASRIVGKSTIPILGVNLGSLGFLTEVTLPELYNTLEKVIAGDYTIEKRMMLRAIIKGKDGSPSEFTVLNDVVINKGALARIISMEVLVNGVYLTTYRADGLIISTPTGSTGYSLSAGGPIVYPSLSTIIITPICPHTLTNRPILVPSDAAVEITLISGDGNVFITLDGQVGKEFDEGNRVVVSRAEREVTLIQPPERDYYGVLRKKLKWGGE
jgi:NAD+ kinase